MTASRNPEARRVLVFHAHPDDEVFMTSVAMLALSHAGADVTMVVATGGELGEQLDDPDLSDEEARVRRGDRLTRSCEQLGVSWEWLIRAGQWIDAEVGGGRSLAEAPTDEIAAAARSIIDRERPDLVLCVGENGVTGHPDHQKMSAATVAALALPGWAPERALAAVVRLEDLDRAAETVPGSDDGEGLLGVPGREVTATFELEPELVVRRRTAMDAYHEGLGTHSIATLAASGSGRPTLLIRTVYELTNWLCEYYVDVPIGASDSSSAGPSDGRSE